MDALQTEWNDLFGQSARPYQVFQSFDWNRRWLQHYFDNSAPGHRLAIATARLDTRLVLIVPLVVMPLAGLRVLRAMGAPVSQYKDAIAQPGLIQPHHTMAVLREVGSRTGADLLELRKVRDESVLAEALSMTGATPVLRNNAPFIDLTKTSTAKDYLARLSANARKQRRKRRRQLSELGDLRFSVHTGGPELLAGLQRAVAAKREALAAAGKPTTHVHDPRFLAFFEDFALSRPESASCVVSVLSCGEDVVASEVGLRLAGHYVAHLGTFDGGFARYAPGTLQIDDTVGWCLEEGISTYDMLAPDDDYKSSFADGKVAVGDYVVPLSWRGALFHHGVIRTLAPTLHSLRSHDAWLASRLTGTAPGKS